MQIDWYADEIRNLKKSLEQHLGRPIGDRELRGAIPANLDRGEQAQLRPLSRWAHG